MSQSEATPPPCLSLCTLSCQQPFLGNRTLDAGLALHNDWPGALKSSDSVKLLGLRCCHAVRAKPGVVLSLQYRDKQPCWCLPCPPHQTQRKIVSNSFFRRIREE